MMLWKADKHHWITDEEEKIIATVVDRKDMPIIAASLEMYEALKEIQKLPFHVKGKEVTLLPHHAARLSEMVNKAISKVEGREG